MLSLQAFRRANDVAGWLVFLVATIVYALTVERTASFWDCGEFVAVSSKLMVPHPPGAPFFLLVGRMFSMLAMDDLQIAYWVNMLSVLSSSFTILFLYWTIVLLTRKYVLPNTDGNFDMGQVVGLIGSGAVGALAYTFSDSFWFSAVEAEVYAMSSFFTALVVWAMFKWEHIEDEAAANRWIIFIAYMMGLSIGVHLLNLLTIPALGLIYYFKKTKTVNWFGLATTMAISGLIVGFINFGIIPGFPSLAAKFELVFINGLGLPFGTGAALFVLLLVAGLVYGIMYSIRTKNVLLNTALLSLVFILVGYTSYGLVLIRSNQNTPIDENNPEDVMTFVSYLKREQYGDRPLIFGQTFAAERIDTEIGEELYRKDETTGKYVVFDRKPIPIYDNENQMLFPRIYSSDGDHVRLYREWLDLPEGQKPTMGDNLRFFFKYQIGHMFLRYFMWNFAGRAGDDKEADWLRPWSASDPPLEVSITKAYDNFYMLPLILGLLGFFFHYTKERKGWGIVMLLFMILGPILVFYLNSPPVEPRERDYVYVGAFYAFAIWMGLGVQAIWDMLQKAFKGVSGAAIATAIGLLVPALMGFKSWDNHNRNNRYLSVDQARNTLASCAPNAVLFTGGDNDTFPLWYVQEVEKFRQDVRVVVLSYLSTDWYIDQLKRELHESKPLPISLDKLNYLQGKNDYVPVVDRDNSNRPIKLKTWMELLNKNDSRVQIQLSDGTFTGTLPSKKLQLPVNKAEVLAKGIIPKGKENRIPEFIEIDVTNNHIFKNDLMILDIIATSNWDRPIYFNNTSANTTNLGFLKYLQMEGMAYRLLPIVGNEEGETGEVNTEQTLKNLKQFSFRGLQDPNNYHDEEFRKFGSNYRNVFLRLAYALMAEGKKDEARQVIKDCMKYLPDPAMPYNYYMPRFVDVMLLLDMDAEAQQVANTVFGRAKENMDFIKKNNLESNFNYGELKMRSQFLLQQLSAVYRAAENRASQRLEFIKQVQAAKQDTLVPNAEQELPVLQKRQQEYAAVAKKYAESLAAYQ
ncbi:MAG: DUF2723 domain-containing protein [Cytophagales bacterium]|nr:MAG: DUF2723 domain-containing protein [Cytophagales bacterium]TAF59445.1 MAG: DUF2723 domain-containing protein [Cytophagales bacterium]